MNDLAKMSSDLILFSIPETGYVSLPKELCSGSSLMPQKKNPCGLELVRAKAATVSSYLFQVLEIIRPLVSGYNRDFQETKAPLMNGFDTTLSSLLVMCKTIEGLQVHAEKCVKAFTPELFATDLVLNRVVAGVPFRTAYQQVAAEIADVQVMDPVANILAKTHIGATGNLGLDLALTRCHNYANHLRTTPN
jgi:argininosuccinate lyase